MSSQERKNFKGEVVRIAGEWKYRMPLVTPAIMLINPEHLNYRIDLLSVLLAGGVGFVAGLFMDRIEKGDPERMKRWFKNQRRF